MTYEYEVQYLKCQNCHARIHCSTCEMLIKDRLNGKGVIRNIEVNLARKQIMVEAENVSEEDVINWLEDTELFVL